MRRICALHLGHSPGDQFHRCVLYTRPNCSYGTLADSGSLVLQLEEGRDYVPYLSRLSAGWLSSQTALEGLFANAGPLCQQSVARLDRWITTNGRRSHQEQLRVFLKILRHAQ